MATDASGRAGSDELEDATLGRMPAPATRARPPHPAPARMGRRATRLRGRRHRAARVRPGGTASSPRTPMSPARPACRRMCTTSTTAGLATSTSGYRRVPRVLRAPTGKRAGNGRPDTCSTRGRRDSFVGRRPTRGCSSSCATRSSDSGSGRTLAENRFTVGSTARAAANAAFGRALYADQLLRLGGCSRASRCSSSSTSAASRAAGGAAPNVRLPRPGLERPRASTSAPRERLVRSEDGPDRVAGGRPRPPLRTGERAAGSARSRRRPRPLDGPG